MLQSLPIFDWLQALLEIGDGIMLRPGLYLSKHVLCGESLHSGALPLFYWGGDT